MSHSHGMSKSAEYRVWCGARARCCNPLNPSWKNYGGRGITMCKEWQNSFQTFYNDVGPKPNGNSRFWQLDRINNDGPYAPGNVRWADAVVQAGNRRKKAPAKRTWAGFSMDKTVRAELSRIADVKGINLSKLVEQIAVEWLEADRKVRKK